MPSKSKRLVRFIFTRFVFASGIAHLIWRLFWRDRVAVILYHDPKPETLDAHLTYLKTICDLVPFSEANKPGNGRRRAAITLDDGHAGNAALLPVFIKHDVRPTIYLCSSIVGYERTHWWMHPGAAHAGVERLKSMTNDERLATLRASGFEQDSTPRRSKPSGLRVEQIEAMRPYVDFQSHTRFHPILTRCDDAVCHEELSGSKREIEQLTGDACEHFAYPNGDYGSREVAMLKSCGYRSARTCDIGWNDHHSDPFRLKAFDVPDDSTVEWFKAQLTGITLYLRYVRQGGGLAGRKPQVGSAGPDAAFVANAVARE
jgi:peptidoglycan/xylan/chitin deacetylase (PgdA/CDA1 family)